MRGQLDVQLRRLVDRLAGFHSASDGDARAKKRDLVHTVLRGLALSQGRQLSPWDGLILQAALDAFDALGLGRERVPLHPHPDDALGRLGGEEGEGEQGADALNFLVGQQVAVGFINADLLGDGVHRALIVATEH